MREAPSSLGDAAVGARLAIAFVIAVSAAPPPTARVAASERHAVRPTPPRSRAAAAADSVLWMEMRNVDLHVDERHVLHVRSLRGEVVPVTPGAIAWLDDPRSFRIRATSGIVALDGDAIATLLHDITFNYPGAPIRNLRVRIEQGAIVQQGTLHKGVDIPFEMWATPVLESDGRLRLHPHKLRILGVNGITLMRALGLHMDRLMDLRRARGASVKGDDLYLDPLQLIPPPTVSGRLQAVRIEGNVLVQEFARTADDTIFGTYVRPDSGSHNFVYFRGGELRFGKLTMSDTDLLINDADEQDPLDLYLAHYNDQLAAGHTKNLTNLGLRTWMVDYHRVRRALADGSQ